MRLRTVIAFATVVLGASRVAGAAGVTARGLARLEPRWVRLLAVDALEAPHLRLLRADLPPAQDPAPSPWLALDGEQSATPGLQRSETGITWSVGEHIALRLTYARTGHAPPMHGDHDNGVFTHLRFAF